MDLSWLRGGSPAGAWLRRGGVGGRGGGDPPSGDPREALGCWGDRCCCPGLGEARERSQPLSLLGNIEEPGAQGGSLDWGQGLGFQAPGHCPSQCDLAGVPCPPR